jgi:RimJ/RimL family protein N-acetyltransferase
MNAPPAAALPPFPASADPPQLGRQLQARGIALRAASAADLGPLARLYAQFRETELMFASWSGTQKLAFAQDQFRLQHIHLVRQFAEADFWTIRDCDGLLIGRLYLDRACREWRIIDILLAAAARGSGLGSALLRWIQASATAASAECVALQVAADNPRARALYLRLGFEDAPGGDGLYQPMRWRPA